MSNIKLTIAYDGSNYVGWQRQAETGGKSIQQMVELALKELLGHPVSIHGAGRTDSGVHAFGQVAHFDCDQPVPIEKMSTLLNRLLPSDICVMAAEAVSESFHSRFSPHKKRYCYLIEQGEKNNPFANRYSWQLEKTLDIAAMQRASQALVGRHDFRHYTLSKVSATNFVREIFAIEISLPLQTPQAEIFPWQQLVAPLQIAVSGNGFLYKMVRLIVGRLVAVGAGRLGEEKIGEFLSGDFWQNIPPAPAQGLFLEKIWYDE